MAINSTAQNPTVTRHPVVSFNGKYPLHELSPRKFEELVYTLLSRKGRDGLEQQLPIITEVELMQGVGERGRDISLYEGQIVVGLIQCKHSTRSTHRLDKTQIVKEILKFFLHAYADKKLIPDPERFRYVLATNIDLSEPAKEFLLNVSSELRSEELETESKLTEIIESTKKLQGLQVDKQLLTWLVQQTDKVTFSRLVGIDINAQISRHESEIIPNYFAVKKVIDSELALKMTQLLEVRLECKTEPKAKPIRDALAGYLTRFVIAYRHMKTLVFRNQQMLLEDLYQPLTLVSQRSGIGTTVENYPGRLLEAHGYILIRSTAGMGKSTLMRRMFIGAVESDQCIRIPILIELRRLSKTNDLISEILNRCDPLIGTSRDEFLQMLNEGSFIFLLDGYDEIKPSDREAVTNDLTSFITRAYKNLFVLTSRPDTALGSFPNFQEFTIRNLKQKEAYSLIHKYGRDDEHSLELVNRLKKPAFRQIRSFLVNPMLVSLLFVAYRHTPRLPYKKHLFYFQVYQAIFEDHDLSKDGLERPKHSELDISDFEKILRHAAFSGSKSGSLEYSHNDLAKLVENAAKFNSIECSAPKFINDLITTVPMFIRDGPYYSWGHKSLQDYFAARFIETAPGELRNKLLEKIYNSNSVQRFAHILEVYREMNPRSFRETILRWLLEDFERHCASDKYIQECKQIKPTDIQKRLELTFGRKVSFRIYDNERSKRLQQMNIGSRIADIIADWNDGAPLILDENKNLWHNKQQDSVLVTVESWEPNVRAILKFLVSVEPSLVSRRKHLNISTKLSWPEDRLVHATEPSELLNQNPQTFKSINRMLQHGVHLDPETAMQELAIIRSLETDETDLELLDF